MSHFSRFCFSFLSVLALASFGCSPSSNDQRLVLTGSSTVAPLALEIAKRYEASHPNVRIDVQTGGSTRGIQDATKGLADIGMSSRALKESEKEGLQSHILAYDGICLLVHGSNPVTELTREQIISIFTGEISNWSEVGGEDSPITVINRAEGRSELELFLEHFGLQPQDIQPDLVSGENQHGLKSVGADPNAIIYMSLGASEFEAQRGLPIKLLPLGDVEASSQTVQAGQYPLTRDLILITQPAPSSLALEFLNFAKSGEVHDLVTKQFYVPVQ